MAKTDVRLLQERLNLRMLATSLVIAGIGVFLLYVTADSTKPVWTKHPSWQSVLQQLGGLLLVTTAITLLWESIGKRAFLDEILAKAKISKELSFSGITQVTDSFHRDIGWRDYFDSANKLDIFFTYGKTWRNTHLEDFQRFVARHGARLRVVLPDPEDDQVVRELARRFKYTTEKLIELIREAEKYFRDLQSQAVKNGASVELWFLPAAPHFTFYRFNKIVIVALYSHRRERTPVPTFVCESGGTFYEYIRREFDAMISEEGLARSATTHS